MNDSATPGGFRVEPAGREGAREAAPLFEVCLREAWPLKDMESLLASGRGRLWLLRDAARTLRGALLAELVLDEAHVHLLAVEPAWRRRGAGTALLRAALGEARTAGARRVLLEVRASGRPALALYAGHGFELVRRRSRYYRDGEDALLLERVWASGAA